MEGQARHSRTSGLHEPPSPLRVRWHLVGREGAASVSLPPPGGAWCQDWKGNLPLSLTCPLLAAEGYRSWGPADSGGLQIHPGRSPG